MRQAGTSCVARERGVVCTPTSSGARQKCLASSGPSQGRRALSGGWHGRRRLCDGLTAPVSMAVVSMAVVSLAVISLAGCSAVFPSDNNGEGLYSEFDLDIRNVTEFLQSIAAVPFASDPVIQLRQVADQKLSTELPPGTRHYLLGGVPIGAPSPNLSDDALYQAIATTALTTDCFVIRQKIDWEAFRPGGDAEPDFTNSITQLVDAARESGFTTILIELDPIVDRHNIGPLPPAIADHDFSSPAVREALTTQAIVVAETEQPDFLSLGVEINGYYESNPTDFENFVSLHKEIYDQVKAVSPDTQVMASFNLEAIQGLLVGVNEYSDHGPQWYIIEKFKPKVDAVAFSTLPFPVFYEPLQIPDDYLSRIEAQTDLPIVISEFGWHSYEASQSSETRQREYLARMIRVADKTPNVRVMAWTIIYDAAEGSIFDAFPDFKYLGMLSWDGKPKEAFSLWQALYERPYEPVED